MLEMEPGNGTNGTMLLYCTVLYCSHCWLGPGGDNNDVVPVQDRSDIITDDDQQRTIDDYYNTIDQLIIYYTNELCEYGQQLRSKAAARIRG